MRARTPTLRRCVLGGVVAVVTALVLVVMQRPIASPTPAGLRDTTRFAVARLAAGDAGDARRMAEAALAADPGESDARFVRACLRAASGDRAGAVADLAACAAADPSDPKACLDAALVARSLARGDPDWAERAAGWFSEAARRAESASPGDVRAALILAASALALGRLDDAKRTLDALPALDGALADDAIALRAALLVAGGDAEAACEVLRWAVEESRSESGSGALAEMRSRLEALSRTSLRGGVTALRRGDIDEARALLRRAAASSPDDLTPVALLAATIDGPDTSRAVDDELRALAGAHPTSDRPAGAVRPLLVGSLLLGHGDAETSAGLFRRALELAPDDPGALRGAVVASLVTDDASTARSLCRARLDRGDDTGHADFLLAVVCEHEGEDALAETSYRDALRKDPAYWPASDRLAESLLRRGEVAESARVCDAALAAQPECLPLRIRRAGVWIAAGDPSKATALLASEARAHPHNAAVHLHLARALAASGDAAGAAASFDTCLREDPSNVAAHVGAIGAAAASGRLTETIARLRAAADASPRDPVARFALGVASETAGDLDAAERHYRAALSIAPSFAVAANNLAWLLAERRGRAAEARPFAETAGRLLPRNPRVLDTRGWVRFLAGDAAAAEPDLARAARMLPGRADVAGRHARVVSVLTASRPSSPRPAPVPETVPETVPEPTTEVPR